jgi:hypothetical protein
VSWRVEALLQILRNALDVGRGRLDQINNRHIGNCMSLAVDIPVARVSVFFLDTHEDTDWRRWPHTGVL